MINGFNCLRHDSVISRNYKDSNVSALRTTGAHCSKGLMPGCVKKDNFLAVVHYMRGADMLGNAAGFTGRHMRFADRIKERCLAVIDMPHYCDNRRPGLQVGAAERRFAARNSRLLFLCRRGGTVFLCLCGRFCFIPVNINMASVTQYKKNVIIKRCRGWRHHAG